MTHPYRDVAVVGVHNTVQARKLEGHDAESIALAGALGALADAGLRPADVDAVVSSFAQDLVLTLRLGPATRAINGMGIPAVTQAAQMIATGEAEVVLLCGGGASQYVDRGSTAPWTRPANEFVVGFGLFTAAEFALMARRHMLTYGTTPEHLAVVAATIRNNGHVNPEAVYFDRGPYTVEDVLTSRMVADPFHLLDCSMTSEGGCGLVLARADRLGRHGPAAGLDPGRGQRLLRAGLPAAPGVGHRSARSDEPAGLVGRRAARRRPGHGRPDPG